MNSYDEWVTQVSADIGEHLLARDGEPTCDVDWGSATASQRCIRPAGHGGVHIDARRREWGYSADGR